MRTYSVTSDSWSVNGIQVKEREVKDSVHSASRDLHPVVNVRLCNTAILLFMYFLKLHKFILLLNLINYTTFFCETDFCVHSHSVVSTGCINYVH